MPPSFASAAALVADALADFLPPKKISVAEWAGTRRWLSNAGGGHVGLWDNRKAPYLVEPMEALTDRAYDAVALAGPGQCGKTEIANNWLGQSIETDPASFLRFMQTDDSLRAYVKASIDPMVDEHAGIKARLGLRPIDDSIGFKRFRGMTVQFLAAARSNLISKSAPRIVCDEVDAYDPSLGDVKNLIDVRRQTFGRDSMALMISHPDRAGGSAPSDWKAGIMALYADSTRCTWWWPCPHCRVFSSPNPGTARQMTLCYPEDAPLDVIAAEASLLCPSNGCIIADGERRGMLAGGKWAGHGQTVDEDGAIEGLRRATRTAGYWIVGVMSPFLLHGIGGLAAARVKAARALDAGEEDTSLREVMTKQWGIPYDPPRRVGSLDAEALADRAEPGLRLGRVPEWVRFVTGFVDVQGRRFEGLKRGWGVDGESAVVDFWSMPAAPATSPRDWDAMIAWLMQPVPLADGSGRAMRVHAAGFDSGGEDGVTAQAYAAWRRAQKAGIARRRGKVDGRDAWTLLPCKGMSQPQAPRLGVVYPDSQRQDRKAAARGQVPLGQFNPNTFKDDLALQLARVDAGPLAVHIPYQLRGDHLSAAGERSMDAPHNFFGQLVSERRTAKKTWLKVSDGAANEAIDLMVGTHVMAHLHGLARLRWDAPAAWFAPQHTNSGVFDPEAAPAGPAPAQVAAARPPAPATRDPVGLPPLQQLSPPAAMVVVHQTSPAGRAARMA